MKHPIRDKTRELQLCACGCGQKGHWNEMSRVRDPLLHSYWVLNKHRDEFYHELIQWDKLRQIKEAFAGSFFFSRWRAAKAWYILVFAVQVRLHGPEKAAKMARRDTLMMISPRWLGRFYSRVTRFNRPKGI